MDFGWCRINKPIQILWLRCRRTLIWILKEEEGGNFTSLILGTLYFSSATYSHSVLFSPDTTSAYIIISFSARIRNPHNIFICTCTVVCFLLYLGNRRRQRPTARGKENAMQNKFYKWTHGLLCFASFSRMMRWCFVSAVELHQRTNERAEQSRANSQSVLLSKSPSWAANNPTCVCCSTRP